MSQPTTTPGENQEENKNHAPGKEPLDDNEEDFDQEDDDPNDDFLEGFDPDTDFEDDGEGTVVISASELEKLKKSIDNAKINIKQKKHYRDKYKKLLKSSKPESMSTTPNEENKTKNATTPSTEIKPVEQPASTASQVQSNDLEKKVDVISLMSSYSYLDKETADEIVTRATKLGISVEEVMNDKFFKPFLEEKRKNYEIDHASLHPSNSSTTAINAGGEEIDWKNAPREVVDKRLRDMQRGSR